MGRNKMASGKVVYEMESFILNLLATMKFIPNDKSKNA